jgi:hypothetical protein
MVISQQPSITSNYPKESPLSIELFNSDVREIALFKASSGLFSGTPTVCKSSSSSGVRFREAEGQSLVSSVERPEQWISTSHAIALGASSVIAVNPSTSQVFTQTISYSNSWPSLEAPKVGPQLVTLAEGSWVSHLFMVSDQVIGIIVISPYKETITGYPVSLTIAYISNFSLIATQELDSIFQAEIPAPNQPPPHISSSFIPARDQKTKKTLSFLYLHHMILADNAGKIDKPWFKFLAVNLTESTASKVLTNLVPSTKSSPFGAVARIFGAGLRVYYSQFNTNTLFEELYVCTLEVAYTETPESVLFDAKDRKEIVDQITQAGIEKREGDVVYRGLISPAGLPTFKTSTEMDPNMFVEVMLKRITEGENAGKLTIDIFSCMLDMNNYGLKSCKSKNVVVKVGTDVTLQDKPRVSVAGSATTLRILIGDRAVGMTINLDQPNQLALESPVDNQIVILPGSSNTLVISKNEGNKLFQQKLSSIVIAASKLSPSNQVIQVTCKNETTSAAEAYISVTSFNTLWSGVTTVDPSVKLPNMGAYAGDRASFTIESNKYTGNDPKLTIKTSDPTQITATTGKLFPHKLVWTLSTSEDKIVQSQVFGRFGLARTDKNRMYFQQCTEKIHGGVHCRPSNVHPLPLDSSSVITTCESPNQETLVCAVYSSVMQECSLYVATLRGIHNLVIGKSKVDRLVVKNPKDDLLYILALMEGTTPALNTVKMYNCTLSTKESPRIELLQELPSNFTFCPRMISDIIYDSWQFKIVSNCTYQTPELFDAAIVREENKPARFGLVRQMKVFSSFPSMEIKKICTVGSWSYIVLKSSISGLVDIYLADSNNPDTKTYFISPNLFTVGKFEGDLYCLRTAKAVVITRSSTEGYIFSLDPTIKKENRMISTYNFTGKATGTSVQEWNMKIFFQLNCNGNDIYVGLTDRTVVELAISKDTTSTTSTYSLGKETAQIKTLPLTSSPTILKTELVNTTNKTSMLFGAAVQIDGPITGASTTHPGIKINPRVEIIPSREGGQPLIGGAIGLESIYAKGNFVATFDASPDSYQAYLEIFLLESWQTSYRSRLPILSLSPQLDFVYITPSRLGDDRKEGVFIVAQESDLGKGGIGMLYWVNKSEVQEPKPKYIMSQIPDFPRTISRIRAVSVGSLKTSLLVYVFSLAKQVLTIQGITVTERDGVGGFGIGDLDWKIENVKDFEVVLVNEGKENEELVILTVPSIFSSNPVLNEYRLSTKAEAKINTPKQSKHL